MIYTHADAATVANAAWTQLDRHALDILAAVACQRGV